MLGQFHVITVNRTSSIRAVRRVINAQGRRGHILVSLENGSGEEKRKGKC